MIVEKVSQTPKETTKVLNVVVDKETCVQNPTITYVDETKYSVVDKINYVDVEKIVEKPVDKIVYVEKIKEVATKSETSTNVKSIKEKVIYEDRIQNVIKTTEVPEISTVEVKKYVNRIIEIPREDIKTIDVERWKEVSEPSTNEIVVYKEVPKFNDIQVDKEV